MGMGSQRKSGAQGLYSLKGQGMPVPYFDHLYSGNENTWVSKGCLVHSCCLGYS